MSQKAGAFWSAEPEQYIDEDRTTISVILLFGTIVLLSTGFDDGEKTSEEKSCK